jgi:uncharacterized protein (TIGR03118 family)
MKVHYTAVGIAMAVAGISACLTATGQSGEASADIADAVTTYHQTNLVSDGSVAAAHTDSHLINPWGLSRGASTYWWASDQGKGVSTLYDGLGNPQALVVTIPSANGIGAGSPTGTVALGSKFVFVTLDGTISAWSSGTSAVIKVNNSTKGAFYTGCTVALRNSVATLYVANNSGGAGGIEAYDTQFHAVTLPAGAFIDPNVPAGIPPYNVQIAGGKIYVTFSNGAPGAGLGYVSAFDTNGTLLLSLEHGTWMNAPWGIALAPANFGTFSHALLVGQLGSGVIVAFNPSTGNVAGVLKNSSGKPIVNNDLWALGFGNGGLAGPTTTLYFTAGIGGYLHGLFGTILPD